MSLKARKELLYSLKRLTVVPFEDAVSTSSVGGISSADRDEVRLALAESVDQASKSWSQLNALKQSAIADLDGLIELRQRRVLVARKIGDEQLESAAQLRLESVGRKRAILNQIISGWDRTAEIPEFAAEAIETARRIEEKVGLSSVSAVADDATTQLQTLFDRLLLLAEGMELYAVADFDRIAGDQ